jgi:hypothetical protein
VGEQKEHQKTQATPPDCRHGNLPPRWPIGTYAPREFVAGERAQRFVPADNPRGKLLDQLARMAP